MSTTCKIMIVAGESSGDTHAAKLVRALREAAPDVRFDFFGAAGPKMRAEGVEAIVESDAFAIVGLAEIAMALPMFVRAYRDLKRAAADRSPDTVVLVDFPDFNLRLARSLKTKGLRVIYYISPQLWAWRKHRVKAVKKYVDLILTILPFEKDWYSKNGIENVEYVGSPLAREVHSNVSKSDFCRSHAIDPDRPIVSLLPGSRQKEISRILPLMLRAAYEIELVRPETQFIIALSSTKYEQLAINELNKLAKAGHGPMNLPVVALNETYEVLNASDAAAVTSGTATLETGIIGTPMVVVYKTSSVNYKLLEPMIDVPHFGLINLIAEQRVAMELIQDKFTPTALATELLRLLEPGENAAMRARLRTAADKLGHGGASLRAAKAILRTIGLLRSDEISPL